MRTILILLALLVAAPTLAADNGPSFHAFTPPPTDTSLGYLAQIFGPVIDGLRTAGSEQGVQNAGGSGDGQTVIGAMMAVYASAVLLLGMVFVMYTVTKGTMDTAHDGELLGRKMSDVWVPLRTVAGTGMLFPLASGFSMLQLGVLWLALHGIGLADIVWNAAMDRLAVNGTLGYVAIPDARPLAASILRSEVCAAAMNKQYADSGWPTRIELVPTSIPVAFGASPDVNSQRFMVESTIDKAYAWRANDRKLNADVCGSITFTESAQSQDMSSNLRNPLLAAHSQAVRAMMDELQPLADQIVAWKVPPTGAIDLAVTHYQTTMDAAAKRVIAATPDAARASFIQYAKGAGWVSAGAFWAQMTRLNDAVQNAINALPTSKAASIDDVEVREALINYRQALSVTEEYIKDPAGAPRAAAKAEAADIRSAADFWRVLSIPAMSALDSLTRRIAGANSSPVTQLRSIGNDVISIGLAIKAAVFTTAGVLGGRGIDWTVGWGFNVLEATKTVTGTAEWLSSALFVIGAMLAYYLPAVPVIWWIMGVIRFLASVAEAVLAAPLMAAMQIHPDGHEIVGKSGPGYMLILAMVIQPTLLLFALLLAILMTYPGAALVNELFLLIVSGTAGNSGVGLVGLVAWTALYVTMMTIVMHSCFALISAVPDNVMRYLAAQAGAQGIVKTGDEAYHGLKSGAAGAGGALASGTALAQPSNLPEPEKPTVTNGGQPSNKDLLGS